MASGWATWYHWVRRWWGGEEYMAPTAEVAQPSGPTSAHLTIDGTRARVYDAQTEAVNLTPGTRVKVY